MKKQLLKKFAAFIIIVMMFSGASRAQWLTVGTNIYNSNTGNVGIGTNAPGGKLHVNTVSGTALNITGTDPYVYINSTSLHTSNSGKDLNLLAYVAPGISLPPSSPIPAAIPGNILLQAPVPNSIIRLGNVGIGTASPLQKLHVNGASILANNTGIDPNNTPNSVIAGIDLCSVHHVLCAHFAFARV